MSLRFVMLAIVLLAGCGSPERDYELDEKSFGPDTLKEIEKETKLSLPAGAQGLNYFRKARSTRQKSKHSWRGEASINPEFATKIELPTRAREEMLNQISIAPEGVSAISGLGTRFSPWLPADAKVLINRRASLEGDYLHIILTAEGTRTFLYLECWLR